MPTPLQCEKQDNKVRADIAITDDLLYFPGHFPGQPILPGFAMIDWVMQLAQSHFELPLEAFEPMQMEVVKFKNVVQPGITITLDVEYRNERVYYVISSDQGEHCSGRILVNQTDT
ncbi:Uncharacterised protein [BD1-7 clade bacterium]|uniref:ApeI dehydratase-like domain-containing protein n=1 Tax=BD1-7 clade bacterium TaxID=2029982 RepID=A0A5S9QMC0_9GAMM|nr:Uncharacterised protein [BD1-7 clade bacterium]CAA0119117.1 Uncharacterised protein [BD1-7 clade bacterium]